MTKYVVVEYAGYDREQDVRTFETFSKAANWVARNYTAGEKGRGEEEANMHIGIRADYDNGEREYVG